MSNLERSLFEPVGMSNPEAFTRNIRYFERNHALLFMDYSFEWVAIVNEGVFAHHKDYKAVVRTVRDAGVLESAYIRFVEESPRKLLFKDSLVSLPAGH